MNKIIVTVYQFFRALRYSALTSHFGYVSHCPHTPTCGSYFLESLKNRSGKDFVKACKQLITCI